MCGTGWEQAGIDTVAPLLKRIFDGINLSAVKGRPYHSLFSLSDEMQTGVVTREAFEHTLTMMGCPLAKEEVQTVLDLLSPRKDKLVDYEELYHLILRTPGVGLLVTQVRAKLSNSQTTFRRNHAMLDHLILRTPGIGQVSRKQPVVGLGTDQKHLQTHFQTTGRSHHLAPTNHALLVPSSCSRRAVAAAARAVSATPWPAVSPTWAEPAACGGRP